MTNRISPLTPIFDEEKQTQQVSLVNSPPGTLPRTAPQATTYLDEVGCLNVSRYINYGKDGWVGAAHSNGVTIVDASDPSAMVSHFCSSYTNGKGVAFDVDRDLYAIGGQTLQIKQLSTNTLLGSIATAGDDETPEFDIVREILYMSRASLSGVSAYDVSTPGSPASLGYVATGGDPEYIRARGADELLYVSRVDGFWIIDTSNPAAMTANSLGGFTGLSQFDFDPNEEVAYMVDTSTGTLWSVDISNPASPATIQGLVDAKLNGGIGCAIDPVNNWCFIVNGSTAKIEIYDITSPSSMTYNSTISDATSLTAALDCRWAADQDILYVATNAFSDAIVSFDMYGNYP